MTNSRGMSLTEVQIQMAGPDLKLRNMIRFKNSGKGTPRCTKQTYRAAAAKANINAYDHENYRKTPQEVHIQYTIVSKNFFT